MLLSHKIALRINQKQLDYFKRAAGTARFAWNQALATWQATYHAEKKVDSFKLERDFNAACNLVNLVVPAKSGELTPVKRKALARSKDRVKPCLVETGTLVGGGVL